MKGSLLERTHPKVRSAHICSFVMRDKLSYHVVLGSLAPTYFDDRSNLWLHRITNSLGLDFGLQQSGFCNCFNNIIVEWLET